MVNVFSQYIGVFLDSDLSWKSRINSFATKFKRANGALDKLRHFVPPDVLRLVYYMPFSILTYNIVAKFGVNQIRHLLCNRICVLQNFAMRIMAFKSPRDSASSLYANFGVLKFSDMVHIQNILLLDKFSHDRMPDAIQSTFAVDLPHIQATRANHTDLLNLPLVETTSLGKYSIRYNALLLSWNFVQSLLPTSSATLRILNQTLKSTL